MPIYEYHCETCGAVSEYLVGKENHELIKCKSGEPATGNKYRIQRICLSPAASRCGSRQQG